MPGQTPNRRLRAAASSAAADAVAPPDLPAAWATALAPEFAAPYYADLSRFVAAERAEHDVYPPDADVFNAFRFTPLDTVRVVVLGQDPYPNPGQGHGLCFSVRPGVAVPASLRNVYKERQADLGLPPPKHGYLAAWAGRGVLLLNAVLTVRAKKPNSHANKGWERFTDAALAAVNRLDRPVVFLLWGSYAQKKAAGIDRDRHVVLPAGHPSPANLAGGFLGSRPFSRANAALEANGLPPVDWSLPDQAVEVPPG